MKRKTAWIITLIAVPLLAAVFTLHAQKQDDGRDKQERSFGVEKIYINISYKRLRTSMVLGCF